MRKINKRQSMFGAPALALALLFMAPAHALSTGDSNDASSQSVRPPQVSPDQGGGAASPVTPPQPTSQVLGTINSGEVGGGSSSGTAAIPSQAAPASMPTAMSMQPASSAPTEETLKPVTSGGITYITGGVGDEERGILDAAEKNYNLRVTNASKDGAFLADVHMMIRNQKGDTLLDTSAGPIFYAQLPAGNYVIETTGQGVTRKQNVTIGKGKASYLHFSF